MGVNAGGSGFDSGLFLGDESSGSSRGGGGRGGGESVSGSGLGSGAKVKSSSSGGVRRTQVSSSSPSHSSTFIERKSTGNHSGGYDGESTAC